MPLFSPDPTPRPFHRLRRSGAILALLPLSLAATACGDGGGGDNPTGGPAAVQSNPVFVAAGTSNAAVGGRTLRVSVGSPLPVGQTTGGAGAQLSLGPTALRP